MSQTAAATGPKPSRPTDDHPVDLWQALDRLTRADAAMIARRREDVRRSRLARRNSASTGSELPIAV